MTVSDNIRFGNVERDNSLSTIADISGASIFVEKGVYARNLGLCRLINSPIAYGESMYQDCETELTQLHNNNENNKPAKRVEQVADAYYKGILRYFGK